MSTREIGNCLQFFNSPNPAAWIMGGAEDQHFLAPCHRRIPCGDVEVIFAFNQCKRAFDHLTIGGADHAGKGMIDGRH